MQTRCTVISVEEADVATAASAQHFDVTTKPAQLPQTPMLELGLHWAALHYAFGNYAGDHPLAFLASGGDSVPALEEAQQSSGRFFAPDAAAAILAALQALSDRGLGHAMERTPSFAATLDATTALDWLGKLRAFLGDTIAAKRGIVVHRFT